MTVRLLTGDCRTVLRTLPEQSVHCCVTSPPYWGLRSYLPDNHPQKHLEIGSEPTVHEWVKTIVDVMREVRRVLRDDGTLWLNLGDSYAGSRDPKARHSATITGAGANESARAKAVMIASRRRDNAPVPRNDWATPGFKPKDLIGQPWRVAFALQEDGWYLRSEIIWNKRNPMPESVRDRPTKSHEQVFLLSKSEHYYYDNEAIKEDSSPESHARYARGRSGTHKYADAAPGGSQQTIAKTFAHMRGNGVGFGHGYDAEPKGRVTTRTPTGWATGTDRKHDELLGRYTEHRQQPRNAANREATRKDQAERNLASASERMGRGPGWRKADADVAGAKNNSSFDAAMAVMPARRNKRTVWTLSTEGFKGSHYATFPQDLVEPCILAGCPMGGVVLDPFGGSGTVGLVADRFSRDAVLIDLDERNRPMAQERITAGLPLLAAEIAA